MCYHHSIRASICFQREQGAFPQHQPRDSPHLGVYSMNLQQKATTKGSRRPLAFDQKAGETYDVIFTGNHGST